MCLSFPASTARVQGIPGKTTVSSSEMSVSLVIMRSICIYLMLSTIEVLKCYCHEIKQIPGMRGLAASDEVVFQPAGGPADAGLGVPAVGCPVSCFAFNRAGAADSDGSTGGGPRL